MGSNLSDMRMIPPIVVDDSNFTSSNVPENDNSEWLIGTAYAVDDEVMVTTGGYHNIYKCEVANTGNNPPDNIYDGTADPVTGYWTDLGATNRWRMFDEKARSYTTNADSIVASITPNLLFNSVAIINAVGDSVNVTVTIPDAPNPDLVVYDRDIELQDLTDIVDYYTWFFEPIVKKPNAVLLDLPAYINGTVTITVTNTGDIAELGGFILGAQKVLGDAVYGTSFNIKDYSLKVIDETTGSISVSEGYFSKIVEYKITMFTSKVNPVYSILSDVRATPAVYIGNEELTETITYGFFRDFSIVMSDPTISNCSLRVEELL